MRWLLGCLSLMLVLLAGSSNLFAQSGGGPGGGGGGGGTEEENETIGRIYNHHSELNLIVWRSTKDANGNPIGDGQEWGLLLPGNCTPDDEDWDFCALEPVGWYGPLTWYKAWDGTSHNVHFEGLPVLYSDIFWCLAPAILGSGIQPVSPWLGWTPTENLAGPPAEAFVPIPRQYEF